MAREEGDETLVKFGLDVLTLAVLAILTTAPIGALGIGLAGPRLLTRQVKGQRAHTIISPFKLFIHNNKQFSLPQKDRQTMFSCFH